MLKELARVRRALTQLLQRVCLRHADALISNSHAAGHEIRARWGVPTDRIVTVHNAVDADRINRLASESLGDHMFLNDPAPLIVSIGSLMKGKDPGTLIKPFTAVKARRQADLVLIRKGLSDTRLKT